MIGLNSTIATVVIVNDFMGIITYCEYRVLNAGFCSISECGYIFPINIDLHYVDIGFQMLVFVDLCLVAIPIMLNLLLSNALFFSFCNRLYVRGTILGYKRY